MSTQKITSLIVMSGLLSGIMLPFGAHAQTTSTQTQLEVIAQLLKQIQELEQQVNTLRSQQSSLQEQVREEVAELFEDIDEGSRGEKVKILQALLAADPEIYPEGIVSGFFGKLTSQAVKKFQKKHGIEQAGRVGPKTRVKLNELIKKNPVALEEDSDDEDNDNDRKEKRPCAKVPPGHLIAPGWLKKQNGVRPTVPECQTIPPGIKKQLSGSTPTSTPDTTAPTISGITAQPSSTSAVILWTTNEAATGKVYYGTQSPLDLMATSTLSVSTSSLATSHSLNLANLTASTTYYFAVESKDAAQNVATSSQQSFATSQ